MQEPASPLAVFLFTLGFVARHAWAILCRIAVPAILGGVALYLLLAIYLSGLSDYLTRPSSGAASRVLGIGAVSVLVMLFFHTRLVSAVAELLLGKRGESFLGIRRPEWRLYVANLQLLLIICFYCGVFWPANEFAGMLMLSPPVRLGINVGLAAILAWIVLRAWFFLLPLCATTGERDLMIRAWQASAGHFWKIAFLVVLLLIPVIALHVGLQILLTQIQVVPVFAPSMSIATALAMQRALLLPSVLLLGGTYVFAAVLATIASIRMYQILAGSGTATVTS